jgi:hypothetical protein
MVLRPRLATGLPFIVVTPRKEWITRSWRHAEKRLAAVADLMGNVVREGCRWILVDDQNVVQRNPMSHSKQGKLNPDNLLKHRQIHYVASKQHKLHLRILCVWREFHIPSERHVRKPGIDRDAGLLVTFCYGPGLRCGLVLSV